MREGGFTLVELLVVMLIVAVITSFAVMSMRSSRGTGGRMELAAAARSYADAIQRYQTDHGRKLPVWNGADWPASAANEGPKRVLAMGGTTVRRPYLKRAVPAVLTRSGPNGATWRTSPPAAGSRGGALVYTTSGAFSFRLSAYWDGTLVCVAGTGVSSSDNAC